MSYTISLEEWLAKQQQDNPYLNVGARKVVPFPKICEDSCPCRQVSATPVDICAKVEKALSLKRKAETLEAKKS